MSPLSWDGRRCAAKGTCNCPPVMRYSSKHKQKTHDRIVTQAARLFREEGYAGCGVDSIMRAAHLTPGGFYAHFRDKDALLSEALTHCRIDAARFIASAIAAGRDPRVAWVDAYLNRQHLDAPGTGCPLPTLAAEIARQPAKVRRVFTKTLRAYIATLGALHPRKRGSRRSDEAIVTIATLAGAVLLARAVEDGDLSERILSVIRERVAPAAPPRRFRKTTRGNRARRSRVAGATSA